MRSLLIVDDYEPTRRGIRALLRGRPDWQICGEATDGLDAVEMAKLLRPDCILMDVTMPRLNGLEATRLILEHAPRTRVVIVTQNDPSVARLQAEGAGACGFVPKSELDDELIPAIEAALASLGSSSRAEAGFPGAPQVRKPDVSGFLSGGGEMGKLIRSMDWAETAIGAIESWPPTLRTMVSFLLANRFPLLLWWGPKYCQLYNDPYRPVLGIKHPKSMGQPASECFAEIWHIIGPLIDTPFNGGQATWIEDLQLEYKRYGSLEEAHFTVAYSAVPDDTAPGGIGGVLATVHEITEKVVGQRRVSVLRDVSARTAEAKTAEAACALAAQALGRHPEDVPFGLFYLIDADRKCAHFAAACGVEIGTSVSPRMIDLEEDGGPMWPLGKVARTCELELLEGLGEHLKDVLPGPWADPPHSAVVIPVHSNITHQLAGFLVAGVSVRLRFDDSYRSFFELLGTQVATAIAAARAHEEERKRAEALAELDRAKTVFFSNISHEFRTPLTLMLGPLEDTLAGSNGRLAPEHREDLTTVYRNSLRLLKLVNSLLDFSRIEAGRIEAIYQPTDICAFTSEVASAFRSAMERAGLRYEVTAENIAEPIYLDRDMWEKIVLNLLSNAFKFTLRGRVSLAVKRSGSSVQIEVRDTGIGIAEKDLPRLFERFHRIEGAQGRTYEGTGIGLALVQELVKLHGGAISVRSTLGVGTTFTVSIPRGKDHIPQDRIEATRTLASSAIRADSYIEEALRWLPDAAEEAGPAIAGKDLDGALVSGVSDRSKVLPINAETPLVLVADDNSDMLAYLSKLLKAEYRVRVASNGLQALRAVRELNPDLILTDIMMPGLDGLGLLQAIRNDPVTAGKPVILLSARAGEEARIDGLQAGADDYIIKPFSARELLARVSAALALAKVRREAADRLEEQVRMRTQELEHRNAEVLEQSEQLRELSARLLHAQDDERRRIARELHDSAGQTLTALSWNLSHIVKATQEDPEAVQVAKDSKSLVNDLTQEIRTISYLLHPPLLDESGLSSALRWYVDGLNQRSDIAVDLELSTRLARLSPELELAIFRIIQECLTNIHRHSESKTAKIRIEQNSETLLVEVKDQGKGIAPDALSRIRSAGSGVGIRGMSERIRHFGGVLDIKSNRGGTKVMVKFPVSKSSAARAN